MSYPDYRGPDGRTRVRSPVQFGEFMRDEHVRKRYWARSSVGWQRVSKAQPNPAHRALAELESGGVISGMITQNVDGLHQAAGSDRVIELHGSLAQVVCMSCGYKVSRESLQRRIVAENPEWMSGSSSSGAAAAKSAPDGDADVADRAIEGFRPPSCTVCGGILKPDVVFFGESVPKDRVDGGWRLLAESDVLLVVGSSLAVYSGRRFPYHAAKNDMPIAIVNMGPTRADDVAAAKVEGRLGVVLPQIAEALL